MPGAAARGPFAPALVGPQWLSSIPGMTLSPQIPQFTRNGLPAQLPDPTEGVRRPQGSVVLLGREPEPNLVDLSRRQLAAGHPGFLMQVQRQPGLFPHLFRPLG